MDFIQLAQLALSVLIALVGFPTLLSLVLTTLEYLGKINDAMADKISFWVNAVAYVGIFYLAVTGQLSLVNSIDEALGKVALWLTQLLLLLGIPASFAITKFFYGQVRSARFLGLK